MSLSDSSQVKPGSAPEGWDPQDDTKKFDITHRERTIFRPQMDIATLDGNEEYSLS